MSEHTNPSGRYPHVVRAFLETPWAIEPAVLMAIQEVIAMRSIGERFTEEEIAVRIGAGPTRRQVERRGAVAILPIHGVIFPRANLFTQMSGGTSVQDLQSSLRDAVTDDDVESIVLDVNSPGGMVDMIPEFAAEIREARGRKRVVAVSNTKAASAALWLASQAGEFVASPSAQQGSIGVFAAHEDISKAEEMEGVKTTLVSAGRFKVAGHPFEPLSTEARALIQERVDGTYADFTADFARGRRVPVSEVREEGSRFGEGKMLSAKSALQAGMVDGIATLEQTVARLQSQVERHPVAFSAHDLNGTFGGPLRSHSTATSDDAWDGDANRARLREGESEEYYRSAHAWQDDDGDIHAKSSYKFIHHEVSDSGEVGAANMTACRTGMAVLNGARGGTTIPAEDREGVHAHLARHMRDAGMDPPPLRGDDFTGAATSGPSFADEASALHDRAAALVDRLTSLAEVERGHLTVAKRESLTACTGALREVTAQLEDVLAATDPDKHRRAALHEAARFERLRLTSLGGKA